MYMKIAMSVSLTAPMYVHLLKNTSQIGYCFISNPQA